MDWLIICLYHFNCSNANSCARVDPKARVTASLNEGQVLIVEDVYVHHRYASSCKCIDI